MVIKKERNENTGVSRYSGKPRNAKIVLDIALNELGCCG